MDTTPLVSIGLPTYNRDKYLPRAIESLLNQTYQNIELIISDNASSDDTYEVCQTYLKKDRRIRYYRNETNIGMVRNFDKVVQLCRGKYFMWASDDDEWASDFVERNVTALENDPTLVLSYTGAQFIGLHENAVILAPCPKTQSHSSLERVKEVVKYTRRGLGPGVPICGVIRAEIIRKINLEDCYGGDILLLMKLTLLGRFNLVSEALLKRSKPYDRNNDIKKLPFYKPGRSGIFSFFIYRIKIFPLMLKIIISSHLKNLDKCRLLPPIFITFCLHFLPKALRATRMRLSIR